VHNSAVTSNCQVFDDELTSLCKHAPVHDVFAKAFCATVAHCVQAGIPVIVVAGHNSVIQLAHLSFYVTFVAQWFLKREPRNPRVNETVLASRLMSV
jgi:hypothetical protein